MLSMKAIETGIYMNRQSWQDALTPEGTRSVFGHFNQSGWQTIGTGKLFHGRTNDLRADDWTGYWDPPAELINFNYEPLAASAGGNFNFGPMVEGSTVDVLCTDWSVTQIRSGRFADGGTLMGLGLFRPHLPHIVAPEWFDLYPEQVNLPPGYWPGAQDIWGNAPDIADLPPLALETLDIRLTDRITRNGDLDAYLRSYYASTSFADAQIGRLLDAMEEQNLWDNTYLVVTSDHGFQLGEKQDIKKFELREISLRVPLFVAGPGIEARTVSDPVSLIDIYPTLCGLAGIEVPEHCSGIDLSGMLRTGNSILPRRSHVESWYPGKGANRNDLKLHMSVRTPQWRLIDYGHGQWTLYNHDPNSFEYDPHEWYNKAGDRPEIVRQLQALLPAMDELAPLQRFRRGNDDDDD